MQQQTPPYAVALQENDPKLAEFIGEGREMILADGALSAKVKTLMTCFATRFWRTRTESLQFQTGPGHWAPPKRRSPKRSGWLFGWAAFRRWSLGLTLSKIARQHAQLLKDSGRSGNR